MQLAMFQNIGRYNGKYIPHYIAGQLQVSGLISDHFYISFAKVFILFVYMCLFYYGCPCRLSFYVLSVDIWKLKWSSVHYVYKLLSF